MKKIGFIFGKNKTFSNDLIDEINRKNLKSVKAVAIETGALSMDGLTDYHVIFDSVSNKVPFYNSILKSAVINGTTVINNPFWNCADDNFLHSALANKMDIKVPKTAILPSKQHPEGTNSETFSNLIYPLNWDEIFDYVGFPAKLKAAKGNAVYNEFSVYDINEFFSAFDLTGKNTMILQEDINFDKYFRAFNIGKKEVLIVNYEPNNPIHMRYTEDMPELTEMQTEKLKELSTKICNALGFDFNAIDFGLKGDEIYVTEMLNTNPVADKKIMTENNYDWLIKNTAKYLIESAKKRKVNKKNYNWSDLLNN